jgi:heptaprenyl diphosphate synthase
MGDFLLSQCFLMIAKLDVNQEVGLYLAKAINRICIGEMKQHKWRYNTAITPLEYIRIVSGKTAALFGVSLCAGAIHGKANAETAKCLGRIGYQIGMAFQLIDDLLDYTGSEADVGKELRKDLIQGYYSLPVIFALTTDMGQPIKAQLEKGIESKEDSGALIAMIKKSGAIEMTKVLARRYNERAMALVERLPEGEGKDTLKQLIPELLKRIV